MPKSDKLLETFSAINRQEWREWLQENYSTSTGVWLIYYKVKSGKPSIRYQEAVQEALCFGWIDSKIQSLDEERYQQVFTPRKPKSVWSKLNKQYVFNDNRLLFLSDFTILSFAVLSTLPLSKV